VLSWLVAVAFAVLVPNAVASADGSTLGLDRTSYVQGQTLVASYATDRVSSTNWIGIYPPNATPGVTASLLWQYTPNASGTASFSTGSLAPGSYIARYLYNDGYTELTSGVPFTVTAPSTGPNLLVNGDAEFADGSISGYDGVTIPGWRTTGVPTIVGYAVGKGFPTASTPGPSDRGAQFFAGGPVGNATLTQSVNVAAVGGQIDAGGVTYALSGWLGGYSSENSMTTVTITFFNGAGAALGTGQIGPVTAADRGNTTKLLRRTASAAVPTGTRSVGVVVNLAGVPARNAANQYNDAYADSLSLSLSAALPGAPAPAVPPSTVPRFDHVFFTMLENKSYDQVIGNGQAPYLSALAANNTSLGASYGVVHPSDPNYLAIAGGSTFGHTDNPWPAGMGSINAPHIGDRVDAAGKTWRGYIEDMGTPCNRTSSGYFDVDNLPFLFFKDIADNDARCRQALHPITQFWTDLQATASTPSFVWFEPNTCNTMHSCSVRTGDDWFRANLPKLLASPAWTQQRSLLIITFDEDDDAHGQRIPTIVIGSPGTVKTGFVSPNRYDHYSVSRTMEDALGLPPLTRNDAYAFPINDIWR
jgi:hypothetical protein